MSTDKPAARKSSTAKAAPKSPPKNEAERKEELEQRSAAAPTDAEHHPDAVVEGPPVVTQDDPTILPAGGTLTSAPDPGLRPTAADSPADEPEGDGKWELFNPTSGPIVYDDEGHFVGGGERVRVDVVAKDSPAARHIAAGRLVKRRPDDA